MMNRNNRERTKPRRRSNVPEETETRHTKDTKNRNSKKRHTCYKELNQLIKMDRSIRIDVKIVKKQLPLLLLCFDLLILSNQVTGNE